MHMSASFAAFTAVQLASLALAAPLSSSSLSVAPQSSSRSVTQVARGFYRKNGAREVLTALTKYGVTPPSHVVLAATAVSSSDDALQSGSVNSTNEEGDVYWVTPVQIGNPPQTLYLDFDTGSSDLWVFSTLLSFYDSGYYDASIHSLYAPDKSSSSRLELGLWRTQYGDGSSAEGVVYSDSVSVGPVTATAQAVEAAMSISYEFANSYSDGLLGLAFDNINTVYPEPAQTFWQNIAGDVPEQVFTVALQHEGPGTFTFGEIDPSQYTGTIVYGAVNTSRGYWETTVDEYAIVFPPSSDATDNPTTSATAAPFSAIVDTGTTLLYLPPTVVSAYYAEVPGANYSTADGGWVFPCSSAPSLPDMSLNIGGGWSAVPGQYMNFAPADDTGESCFGSMQEGSEDLSILGDVFLKSVFAVFDFGAERVGFAQQA